MVSPASQVASLPRRGVVATGDTASTMPSVPPFRAMMPTIPPSRSENTTICVCPESSASAGTMKVSTVRQVAASGLKPATASAPSHTPANSAASTSRKISASRMATSGGTMEYHAGA